MSRQGAHQILLCQLFQLDNSPDSNQWVYVNIGYATITNKNELQLLQKDNNEEVHRHTINQHGEYSKSDSIQCQYIAGDAIQFSVGSNDFALSFQNKSGAEVIWEHIQKILSEQPKEDEHSDEDDIQLTPINESTLPKILETMNVLVNQSQQTRTMLSNYIINKKGYLERLQAIFEHFEQTNNKPLLNIMCSIVKHIVTVAEHELFQVILSDQFYQFIFGTLEYDNEVYSGQCTLHRKFFKEHCAFVQVVQVRNKEKQRLIHFIYRLSYLRDCGLAYYIDEMQLIFIKIIIKNCYGELIKYFENSKDFLIDVIDQLRNLNINALKLLLEICSVLKEYQDISKVIIYQKLSEYGLYEILEDYLIDYSKGFEKLKLKLKKNKQIKLPDDYFTKIPSMVLDLLTVCLQHQPSYFRSHIVSDHQQVLKYPLYNLIVNNAVFNADESLQDLFMDVLKYVIDQTEENNEASEVFLSQFYVKLADGVNLQCSGSYRMQFLEITLELAKVIRPSIKEALIQGGVCQKLAFIAKQNLKFEQLKCLQLIKLLLLLKDDDINNQIVHVVGCLIDMLLKHKKCRENLIYSQLLELIKIIYESSSHRNQNELEDHLQDCHEHPNYPRVYEVIKTLKNSCLKAQFSQNTILQDARVKDTRFNGIDDEMDLFKSVQGHNNNANAKIRSFQKQLVDYEEEVQESMQKKVKTE